MSSPPSSPKHDNEPAPSSPPPRRHDQQPPVIDPALDPKPPLAVPYYHPYYPDRWQQPGFAPVFASRYPPPPSSQQYEYDMPHRVDSADRNAQPRPDDRAQYDHHPASQPSPPPIATLHDSPAPEHAALASPSPPAAYYPPPPQNGPAMNQAAYPYPPHARYPADPAQHGMPPPYPPSSHYPPQVSTRSIRPTFVASHPLPPAPYIIHTDDAATKLNDRIRRKCYNCRTTDTSTWRRSSLTPGKVLCNKCGLFERTHSRPRPEQFPHKRGPVVQNSFKTSRSPPPSAGRLPPISAQMPPNALPPHHYDHPSIAPLMPRGDPQQQQQQAYAPQQQQQPQPGQQQNGNALPDVRNLLNGSPSQQQQQQQQQQEAQAAPTQEGASLKRAHSNTPERSPRQEQRSPPYTYRAPATAAAAA